LEPLGTGIAPTDAFRPGRIFFGAATLGSGLLQLWTGAGVRIVQAPPTPLPTQALWPYLGGVVLVGAGLAILSCRAARLAATVVGLMLLLVVLPSYVPSFVANPVVDRPFFRGFMWTNPCKIMALVGGAALLAERLPGEGRHNLVRGFARLASAAATFLALFLVVCGMQHFIYADFVVKLVPSWIPPQMFWTYFTGTALMAGGVGIHSPPTARLAAAMSALMIFLWVLMLHIPRAITLPEHAFETAGAFEALALSGVALIVASTRD
jgi:uncharacterized membrane protein